MNVTLILIVCLLGRCQDVTPPQDGIPYMACVVQGQQLAQDLWLRDHPKWTLAGWRCQLGRQERGA